MSSQASGSAQEHNNQPAHAGSAAKAPPRPKIGEMLIEAELISDRAFYECLSIAQQSYQPVGQIITQRSYITQQDIDSALLLQSLVASQKMKRREAVQTLREASLKRVAVVELLKDFNGEGNEISVDANSFAHFLRDCGLLNYEQLAEVLQTSSQLNIELVRILIPMNLIDVTAASKVLNALSQVKSGKIDYAKAISAVQMTNRSGCSLQEALAAVGSPTQSPGNQLLLGELIARSGIVPEIEILAAVEAALMTGQRLGETLLSSNAVSLLTLQNALEIQSLLAKGLFERYNAIFVLKHLTSQATSLADFATKTGLFQEEWPGGNEILKLLLAANIVDEKLIVLSQTERAAYSMDALRALLASGRLTANIYQMARDIRFLVEDGRLSDEDSAHALQACVHQGVSLIDYMPANDAMQARAKSARDRAATQREVEVAPPAESKTPASFMARLARLLSTTFLMAPFGQKRKRTISHRPRQPEPRPYGNNRVTYSQHVLDELPDRM